MRTIIAGSRDVVDIKYLKQALAECGWIPSVVISGCARGPDQLGEIWAKQNNVPIELFPAEWQKYGKSAGMIRNAEMARKAEALIALWDGKSRGTLNMIETAEKLGLKVFVFKVSQ